MKFTGRTSLVLLIVCICLLLGILLRGVIQEYLITPIALVLWLLWRYFQSIDQAIIWSVLVFALIFYVLYRALKRSHFEEQPVQMGANAALENLHHWRSLILITRDEIDKPNLLKKDLGWMLVSLYAATQDDRNSQGVFLALKKGDIPLPGSIHSFLFSAERENSHRTIVEIARAMWQAPHRWMLHWSGRDKELYYRSIEEVLNFMDSMTEMKK
jgi:hypothetical protein